MNDDQIDGALDSVLGGAPQQAGKPDPIDAALDQVFGEESLNAKINVNGAVRTAPEQAAEARRLSGKIGVPEDVALRNLPKIKEYEKTQDLNAALSESPALRRQFQDPGFAAMAQHDTDNLRRLERTFMGTLQDAAVTAVKGAVGLPQSIVGLADIPTGGRVGRALESAGFRPQETQKSLSELYSPAQQAANQNVSAADGFLGTLEALSDNPSVAATTIGESLPQMLGGAGLARGLTALSARIAPMVAAAFGEGAIASGAAASNIRSQTEDGLLTPGQSAAAISTGLVNAAVSLGGANVAGRVGAIDIDSVLAGGVIGQSTRNAATKVFGGGAAEGAEELLQSASEQALSNVALDRDIGQGVGSAAALGLVSGATTGAVVNAVNAAAQARESSLVQAQQQNQVLSDLMDASGQSQVRALSPASFAAAVQEMAENGNEAPTEVYIEAQVLSDAFQQSGMTEAQLTQMFPGVAEQMQQALQTGDDIALPIGQALAAVPGTPLEATFRDNARTSREGLSRLELADSQAQTEAFLQTQVASQVTAAQQSEVLQTGRDEVLASILSDLNAANAYTAPVNNTNAFLAANFFAVTAERLGVTPQALYQDYQLRVNSNLGLLAEDPRAFNQADTQPATSSITDKMGDAFNVSVSKQAFGFGQTTPNSVLVEVRDAKTGERRGFVDFSVREDGVLTSENVKVAPNFRKRGLAESMYRAAREAGYDIAPGRVQTDDGLGLVGYLQAQGLINKEAIGPRFRAGDLDIMPLEGGSLNQQANAQFRPTDLTITLLQNANLSSFVHELGHFFLEVQSSIASKPGAPAAIVEDMGKILSWFGVADVATWRAMTLEQQRPYHEKFAESFEQYLFEGKAPSAELHPTFSTVRAWMTSVYKTLSKFLSGRNLQLNDEVRGVFDRMLASDQAIEDAQRLRGYSPLFADPEAAGMTPQEWLDYQAPGAEAVTEAQNELQGRSLREMRLLTGSRNRALKALQQDAKQKRKDVEADVTQEIDATPIEQARSALRDLLKDNATAKKEVAEKQKQWRAAYSVQKDLATAEVEAGLPLASKQERKEELDHRMAQWEMENEKPSYAILPDDQMEVLAARFGFQGGAALTSTLASAPGRMASIQAASDLRMLQLYGDTTTPQGMQRAADEAVHNEARGRFLAAEFRAAQRIGRQRSGAGAGSRISAEPVVRAAKEFAKTLIARKKVKDVKPNNHRAAEARAAKAAQKALAQDDMQALEVAARDRLLQFYAAKEASRAEQEIERGVDYLKKFDKESVRKGLDVDYVDQIDQMLERYDLRRSTTQTEIRSRATLADWIESQRKLGIEPTLPDVVLRNSQLTSYKELSVEDFRGLVEAVKHVEHLGRLKKKLLTAKDKREFEKIRDDLIDQALSTGGPLTDPRSPTTPWGKTWKGIRHFGAAHLKAALIARRFDGGKDGGPWWEYLIRPANEAGDFETTMRAKASEELQKILEPAIKGQKMNKAQHFPSIGRSLTKQERMAIALNTGNASNIQRLLGGEGWTMAQITPALESLTATDWKAIQGVWDHIESYRPLIAAKERRVSGVEPEWIQAQPLVVNTADGDTVTLRGGYYPVKYDPSASIFSEQHADAESARQQMQGAYNAATTRRGFVKARADEVFNRPLLYDLSGMYSGVNDVIHDLAWHEWLIDANRLFADGNMDSAIRKTHGPILLKQFKTWRESIAVGDGPAQQAIDGAIGWLRRSVSVAGLGFNVMSAAMQPIGLTQSIVRLGGTKGAAEGLRWISKGLRTYLSNPLAAMRSAAQMSEFMANRQRTQFRDMNEVRNRVMAADGPISKIHSYSFWLMMRVQQMVDVPTWHAAYERAIADGEEDARAVALADQVVIDAQGSGLMKDQSAIEGGGPTQKLFTVFYSFMNTAMNLGVSQVMTQKSKAKLAVDLLLIFSIPAVLGAAVKMALTPGEIEDEDIAKRLAGAQVGYLFGMVVLGRDLQTLATGMLGLDGYFHDYKGPAGLRAFVDVFQLGKQASQGEFDDAFRKAFVNATGSMFGLPAAQINKTITGADALIEGGTDNPAAILFGVEKSK